MVQQQIFFIEVQKNVRGWPWALVTALKSCEIPERPEDLETLVGSNVKTLHTIRKYKKMAGLLRKSPFCPELTQILDLEETETHYRKSLKMAHS